MLPLTPLSSLKKSFLLKIREDQSMCGVEFIEQLKKAA
jgi:hypothetical protein